MRCTSKYKKLLLVEIRVILFILHLRLESLPNQTKSAVASGYENFFILMLDQHSSKGIRIFFIFCLISIHPEVEEGVRNFMLLQHPSWGEKKFFGKKHNIF